MQTTVLIIDDFLQNRRNCNQAKALKLLNEIDEEILFWIPLRRDQYPVGMTANAREVDLDETILRVWSAELWYSATQFRALDEADTDSLDIDFPDWRNATATRNPVRWYEFADMDSGQIGVDPPCDVTTIAVSNATNASPIVVTCNRNHGLADGDQVKILGVLGNTAANGTWYVDVTGATTFRLYSDSTLVTPVAGSGAYTSGGFIACEGSPMLVLQCSRRVALTYSPSMNMPSSPKIVRLYRAGMDYLWSFDRNLADRWDKKKDYEALLAEQATMKIKRAAHKEQEVLGFKQRPNWRSGRSRQGWSNDVYNP